MHYGDLSTSITDSKGLQTELDVSLLLWRRIVNRIIIFLKKIKNKVIEDNLISKFVSQSHQCVVCKHFQIWAQMKVGSNAVYSVLLQRTKTYSGTGNIYVRSVKLMEGKEGLVYPRIV